MENLQRTLMPQKQRIQRLRIHPTFSKLRSGDILKVLSNEKKGGVVWYQSIGIGVTYIFAIFLAFLKNPCCLN